jgi:hypothetical protein
MKIVNFSKKLLWSHIKEMYPNQWVLLSDVDWPTNSITPKRACVVAFSTDRRELLANQEIDQVLFYIGVPASLVVEFDAHGIAA